eukprot:295828-Pelagomonas_calceolata.AAC.1
MGADAQKCVKQPNRSTFVLPAQPNWSLQGQARLMICRSLECSAIQFENNYKPLPVDKAAKQQGTK